MAYKKKSKTARKLEQRKSDLTRRVRGLRYLAGLGVAVWLLYLAELFLAPETSWYGAMFHLIWPGYVVLFLAIALSTATEYVAVTKESGEKTAPVMRKWMKLCGISCLPGLALTVLFFAVFLSAPGTVFFLFGLPAGVACGLWACWTMSGCNRDENAEPDWALASFLGGVGTLVMTLLPAGVSFLLGDTYDAHYALAVFGSPALIYLGITGSRAWKRHCERISQLPEPEIDPGFTRKPMLTVITGGLVKPKEEGSDAESE